MANEGVVLGPGDVSDELPSDGIEEPGPDVSEDIEELEPSVPDGVDEGGTPHIHVNPGVGVGVGSSVGDDCIKPDVDGPTGVVDDKDKVVDDEGNLYGLYPVLPVVEGAGVVEDVNKYGMNPGDGDPVVVAAGDVEDGILYGINPVGVEVTEGVVD